MKAPSISLLTAFLVLGLGNVRAQSVPSDPLGRPRSVTGSRVGNTVRTPAQSPSSEGQIQSKPVEKTNKPTVDEPRSATTSARDESGGNPRRLSPVRIHQRINEAERLMKSRPVPTALSSPAIDYVTMAALLPETGQIHLIGLAKQTFLTKGTEVSVTTSLGLPVQLRVLRANGVNTAVSIFDDQNRSLTPLVVEFPIERFGRFREMAYYTSAHPTLLSADLTKAGQLYVNSMVDLAAKRLRDKHKPIAQNIVDVAKRLCIVEHVDHDRFRAENRLLLFEEIYSLYALNELDTYRYSVSSAGAGGMVQMIPWTYRLMRDRHPGVGLNPDFVLGMRNHGNALEAMLLYMQDTWNDLLASEDVQSALAAKQATFPELMAAGYNSNAAKLPGYIRRGGAGWKALIPRETQIYLQIYQSFDSLMPVKKRD